MQSWQLPIYFEEAFDAPEYVKSCLEESRTYKLFWSYLTTSQLLSLKDSLGTRKLSQISSGQLFLPYFEIKSYKSGDVSLELSLRYRLYDA